MRRLCPSNIHTYLFCVCLRDDTQRLCPNDVLELKRDLYLLAQIKYQTGPNNPLGMGWDGNKNII